jgi:NDP-sugar pyrophosphorylase family protein
MEPINTLVLAAGKGTRIKPISGRSPKPLLDIFGETILGRNLRWLASQGIQLVWINLHYKPNLIRKAIDDGSIFGVEVQYVYETKILGTAGALRNAANYWDNWDTCLVVYGDNLIHMDLEAFSRFHHEHGAMASVAVFDQHHHVHSGIAGGHVVLDEEGRLLAFLEMGEDSVSSFVNAGIYLLQREAVLQIPENCFYDFGHDLFPRLLAEGQEVFGHLISGYCLGLDTPESYKSTIEIISSGKIELA